jgi:hypothetical protein
MAGLSVYPDEILESRQHFQTDFDREPISACEPPSVPDMGKGKFRTG